jgi:hypothetical protein
MIIVKGLSQCKFDLKFFYNCMELQLMEIRHNDYGLFGKTQIVKLTA